MLSSLSMSFWNVLRVVSKYFRELDCIQDKSVESLLHCLSCLLTKNAQEYLLADPPDLPSSATGGDELLQITSLLDKIIFVKPVFAQQSAAAKATLASISSRLS